MLSEYFILWRNFHYGAIELNMLRTKFSNVDFGCSPYHLSNNNLQKNIKQVDIRKIIPESVSPHLQILDVGIITRLTAYKPC